MRTPKTLVCRLFRQEGGFTLIELMVTMMLMLVVMFALYSIFDMSIRVFSFGNDKTEAVENARLGLERMERELRAAYPYTKLDGNSSNDSLFQSYGSNPSNSITFSNDLDRDNQVDSDASTEQITYSLSGASPPALLRNGDPIVEFVQPGGLTFTFCRVSTSCNPASPPSITEGEAKLVRVELKVRVKRGATAATQTLRTDVTLRNRNI